LTRAVRWHVRFLAAPLFLSCTAVAAADSAGIVESYVSVPMPPGFKVVISELEGPIFADARGHTLYMWPSKKLRNGYSGEMKGKPACYDEVRKETAGLMSPYPAGVLLPDLATRPSCIKLWPPVLASGDAKPVGKWTILTRKDGTKQWAYDEQALYTSTLDQAPGEAIGGSTRKDNEESPAVRVPVAPPPKVPPGFAVKTTSNGRLLTTDRNYSVYTYDKDSATESKCDSVCVRTWIPLIASQLAQAQGEWSTIERSAGLRQWTFRGKPLYTYVMDTNQWSQEGSDVPGWRNVYTQRVPPPPADFTVQDSVSGQVLADHRGMTIYLYNCGDDSVDQLSCDHPDDTQVYRLAMCGAGDAVRCLENWPYVPADKIAMSTGHAWTVMRIDPKSGRRAAAEQPGAVSVWAYRERPVYTYAGDRQPGDINGDSAGEWRGYRNGFKAFWLRVDYHRGAL
jgi:predicted lipoprotein with Yx(FWY)xxD motif